MLNFMKSEWYRIIHSKEIYLITGLMSLAVLFMNIVISIASHNIAGFKYGLVSFSLNTLTSNLPSWMFCIGTVIVGSLYAEERKNGTMKNSVAYGISRISIFIGKCLMGMLFSVLSLAVILIVLVSSAVLLLDGPTQEPIRQMLFGVGAALPSAFASAILTMAMLSLCRKEIMAYGLWIVIMYGVPVVTLFAGFQFEPLSKAAEWMPWNFLNYEVQANMSGYNCLWDTPYGLMKCLVAGGIGILVFTVVGLLIVRKKDIR